MSFTAVRLRPCITSEDGFRRAISCSRTGNMGSFFLGGERNLSIGGTSTRNYIPWSPSTSEGKTSLNSPSATEGVQHHPHQQQHQQPLSPLVNPKPPRKTAQAVAMEEFAALERKFAPPRRKTPEEIAMEEFAALERKLGSAPGVAEPHRQQRGLRKARSLPSTKPEVLESSM